MTTRKIIIASIFIVIIGCLTYFIISRPRFDLEKPTVTTDNTDTSTTTPSQKLPPGSEPIGDSALLHESTWIWEETVLNDDTRMVPRKYDAFKITFNADGKVSGTTDCNSFFGEYNLGSDGILSFGNLGQTLMFCEGSQESEFISMISNVQNYSISLDKRPRLLLYYSEGVIILNSI